MNSTEPALKPQRIAIYLGTAKGLADLTELLCFYVPFANSFPLSAPGWVFVNSFNCEVWPGSGWIEVKATGGILSFTNPKELPELILNVETRGALDYQTDLITWSSHRGRVSRRLLREFGRNVDGTLTESQKLTKQAELRILNGAHGQATMTRGRLDLTEEIARTARELATGQWATT